jgi:DNA-binding transcriptional regulator YhcF (GntR family)
MAIELGVHFNTVAEAYRQLATEGWLDLKHGKAAVVLERAARVLENPVRTEEFRNRLRSIIAQMLSEGVSADSIAAELRAIAKAVKET